MNKKGVTIATIATAAILSTPLITEASEGNYEVKKGDTLYSIAKKHNTTVSQIKQLNSLKSDLIFPKQKLIVSKNNSVKINNSADDYKLEQPVKNKTNVKKYTIVSGDTLIKIANKYNISLAELRAWNNISGHLIYPGQKLIVSKSNTSYTDSNTNSQNNSDKEDNNFNDKTNNIDEKPQSSIMNYRIKSGDTLTKIARQFGLSVSQIKVTNNLTSDLIFAGQTLKIVNSEQIDDEGNINDSFAEVLVKNAKKLLGTPYMYGGITPDGFDCSGFIYYVFNNSNKAISRTSTEGYYNRSFYVNEPIVGDLVFFENTYKKGISHMGIYIGDNKFIHSENKGVIITDLNNSYYKEKFDGFKRFY